MLWRFETSFCGKIGLLILLVVAQGLVNLPHAKGLTILSNFIPAGNNLPDIGTAAGQAANTSGNGNLQDIFGVAASAWERVILDDFTLTLNYGWYPTEPISSTAFHQGSSAGGVPQRELQGSIAFNSDNAGGFRFFLDGTPHGDEEFGTLFKNEQDFGAGLIGIRRQYSAISAEAIGSVDLLRLAMHEIGHALGLVGWSFYQNEVSDGDIDVVIAPFTGTTLPVTGSHLNIIGPMMALHFRPLFCHSISGIR